MPEPVIKADLGEAQARLCGALPRETTKLRRDLTLRVAGILVAAVAVLVAIDKLL